MKKIFPILIVVLLLSCAFIFKQSDVSIERLKDALYAYNQERPAQKIYLHIDKNVYQPGETIWLKAYFKSTSKIENETLYVTIVDQNQKVVCRREFFTYDERSHGDITLPDSLGSGNYQLLAYTDKMINFDPNDVFVQSIKVIGSFGVVLNVEAFVTDSTSLSPGKNVEILCKVTDHGISVKNARGLFKIITSSGLQVTEGRLTTNQFGVAFVKFKYPQISPYDNLRITAQFVKEQVNGNLNIHLPPLHKTIKIQVYPEGGKLLAEIPCKMLISIVDELGNPQSCQVKLKKDGKILSTVTTDIDGQVLIMLKPEKAGNYNIVAMKNGLTQEKTVPIAVEMSGWAMKYNHSGKNPTLMVYNQTISDSGTLVIRSIDKILWHKFISVKSGDSLLVKLPSINAPQKELSIALFNNEGKVSSERLMYAQNKQNCNVIFNLSKAKVGQREKIKVTLKITDFNGKPIKSNLSVATVVGTMLDSKNYKTIMSYADFFEDRISNISISDDILIGRRWNRNTWIDITTYTKKGNVSLFANSAGIYGIVKNKKRKERPFKGIYFFGSTLKEEVQIKPNGTFSIPAVDLLANTDNQNYIFLDEEFNNNFSLVMKDYNSQFEDSIRAIGKLVGRKEYSLKTINQEISGINGVVQLKEVVVKAKRQIDSLSLLKLLRNYPNNCKDYVCMQGVLNCSRHKDGIRPTIGMFYKYNGDTNYIYTKCINCCIGEINNYLVKSISLPNNFPLKNYEIDKTFAQDYLSTIYWNPNIDSDVNGDASFEFYTSDLKGNYKIIVQGLELTQFQPVYGTTSFSVE